MAQTLNARDYDFKALNERVRSIEGDICIQNCCGERFVASGAQGKTITIAGTPGNALGCYLNGAELVVQGNVQDAVGDTMNDGRIVVHGSAGDALGYAMRGGKIFVRGNAGYRTGIHMKQYKEKRPVIFVGGSVGSFLGEYQAGGCIVVLGLQSEGRLPVGNFAGTGQHGGEIFLRCEQEPTHLPAQIAAHRATAEDLARIADDLRAYCAVFALDLQPILASTFWCLQPNAKNPYRQMYTNN